MINHSSKTVAIIGSGMGSLTTAALLAKKGLKVHIFEQNYLPGGCTSSYWRKGFVFEAGATTLVGLDRTMPLRHLLDQTGIEIPVRSLELPMQVHLNDGRMVNRYSDLNQWITEAERVFGVKNQREFWSLCYQLSAFVWKTSLEQRRFPPSTFSDVLNAVRNASFEQVWLARYAFVSTQSLLARFELDQNQTFVDFVNEQLLISAQNHAPEVNALFGATALCYTNYGNYYVDGGLINLVQPIIDYIEQQGGTLNLREGVELVEKTKMGYRIYTKKGEYEFDALVSGVPINNTLELFPELKSNFKGTIMQSNQLFSAFQMGIGFVPHRDFESIHHQIHLDNTLPGIKSASIFISLSHHQDASRCDHAGHRVMSVSTHIRNPENEQFDKTLVEEAIINQLVKLDFIRKENIVYQHSSSQHAWQKWTGRAFGFVGGYPQYFIIKPWQMNTARLDGKFAYLCGDTAYPGQGIPGTVLSGIIAYEKMMADGIGH